MFKNFLWNFFVKQLVLNKGCYFILSKAHTYIRKKQGVASSPPLCKYYAIYLAVVFL